MELSSFVQDFENYPKSIQLKLIEYAEFLVAKAKQNRKLKNSKHNFSFAWEDGLHELKDQFTSVELQHKINELR
ncbi:MAG: DUF2281 domain-containing protein [Bacteroidetes bacterium]|nr:DUF2281 domain-containing protein [Bacteroidota bacterium]